MVVIGNENAGKSTLAGQLISQCYVLEDRVVENIEAKIAKIGEENIDEAMRLAWILDVANFEREVGKSVRNSVRKLETSRLHITIVVAPGSSVAIPRTEQDRNGNKKTRKVFH